VFGAFYYIVGQWTGILVTCKQPRRPLGLAFNS